MVVLAQLVEHRIVVPGVVGSSPTLHPQKNIMIPVIQQSIPNPLNSSLLTIEEERMVALVNQELQRGLDSGVVTDFDFKEHLRQQKEKWYDL